MHPDLKYITENYLTLDQLSEGTGLDVESIQKLIEGNIIPAASYSIKTYTEIFSPLGDKVTYEATVSYFSRSVLGLVQQNQNAANVAEVKQAFRSNFRQMLQDASDKEYAYGNIFNHTGELDEQAFDNAFEAEWNAYAKGIYGICTLEATEEEIVKKEIAVKKLIEFNQKYGGSTLSDAEKEQLIQLKEEFDQITNLFAPYQRPGSSRGKYLDKLLKKNGLSELVRQYN